MASVIRNDENMAASPLGYINSVQQQMPFTGWNASCSTDPFMATTATGGVQPGIDAARLFSIHAGEGVAAAGPLR
jgi:hypothetical protein